jgi:hypothetical protein
LISLSFAIAVHRSAKKGVTNGGTIVQGKRRGKDQRSGDDETIAPYEGGEKEPREGKEGGNSTWCLSVSSLRGRSGRKIMAEMGERDGDGEE